MYSESMPEVFSLVAGSVVNALIGFQPHVGHDWKNQCIVPMIPKTVKYFAIFRL